MAITPIVPFPARNDPTFSTRVESFFQSELVTYSKELDVVASAMNTNDTRGNSTTAHTPATGDKTFTVESGKSWIPGMYVSIGYALDGTDNMLGVVKSYSGTTLVVNVKTASGTTSRADWKIALSSASSVTAFSMIPILSAATLNKTGSLSSPNDWNGVVRTTSLSSSVVMRVVYSSGAGIFIASYPGFASVNVSSSTDGDTWTNRSMPTSSNWVTGAGVDGFLAAESATGTIAKSADGITWSSGAAATNTADVSRIPVALGTTWLVTRSNTEFNRSTNFGASWTTVTSPVTGTTGPRVIGSVFILSKSNSADYYTSETGLTGSWTLRTKPGGLVDEFVVSGDKVTIYNATTGGFYSTADGTTWTSHSNMPKQSLTPYLFPSGVIASFRDTLAESVTVHGGVSVRRPIEFSAVGDAAINTAKTIFLIGGSNGKLFKLDLTEGKHLGAFF